MASKPNPLIAAVLKEIPGAEASRAQRIAWLRLLAMTMDTVYGAPEGTLELPDFLGAAKPEAAAAAAPVALAPSRPQIVRSVEPPRFYIDTSGVARQAPSHDPITPEMIGDDPLFDDRGEFGDLGSIQWADGRRGVLGLRLNISATPELKRA